MEKYIQPNEVSCLGTAVACVLEISPLDFYDCLNMPFDEVPHIEQIKRLLLRLGHRPVELTYAPCFYEDGIMHPVVCDFWGHMKRGVLCTDSHAYAYDGTIWNPAGRVETNVVPVFGLDF